MSCYYTMLGREALLHIQGPDARTFLQGQVTCDTRKLSASAALPGSYCTVQGRVVCDFLLCALAEDHLVLRMRREIRAQVQVGGDGQWVMDGESMEPALVKDEDGAYVEVMDEQTASASVVIDEPQRVRRGPGGGASGAG